MVFEDLFHRAVPVFFGIIFFGFCAVGANLTDGGFRRWGWFYKHILSRFVVGKKSQIWKLVLWPFAAVLMLCFLFLMPVVVLLKGCYDACMWLSNWYQHLPD